MATKTAPKKIAYKWKFAIGTTSRVPDNPTWHYFIADYDGKDAVMLRVINEEMERLTAEGWKFVIQETPHGFHLYSNLTLQFYELIQCLKNCGADRGWLRIGKRRGYFFLADKDMVLMSWPVERMMLHVKDNEDGQKIR